MIDKTSNLTSFQQILHQLPDEIIRTSQMGNDAYWIPKKVNALKRFKELPEIDFRSKLWKGLSSLEFNTPFTVAGFPRNQNISFDSQLDDWSGIIEISEERVSIFLDEKIRNRGVIFRNFFSTTEGFEILKSSEEKNIKNKQNRIWALTEATANHGAYLFVPDQLNLDKPFKIIINLSDTATYFSIRFMTKIGRDSSAKVVFEFGGGGCLNDLSLIPLLHTGEVGENSVLEVIAQQSYAKSVVFLPIEVFEIRRNAILNWFIYDRGSQITNRIISVNLKEPEGNAQITGIYMPEDNQKFFYDTHQNHLADSTKSMLLFKGVLDGNANSVWKGNILVEQGVSGADGYQLSNTLMLNQAAHAESIPGLEICTDDVKCSHGVTISRVDKEQLFYLQTRGIKEVQGKNLIVDGFVRSALKSIKAQDLQNYVEKKWNQAEQF